jgi:hypothetical protein
MPRTSSTQCAWCPWDCPSPEVAACRENAAELNEPAHRTIPSVLEGVCEPAWTQVQTVRSRATTDVIRDLADYEESNAT